MIIAHFIKYGNSVIFSNFGKYSNLVILVNLGNDGNAVISPIFDSTVIAPNSYN